MIMTAVLLIHKRRANIIHNIIVSSLWVFVSAEDTYKGEAEVRKRERDGKRCRIASVIVRSIVFGRIRDQVHKFPWHSRGSALSLIPRAKTLKVWTDKWGEAVKLWGQQSAVSDTDRWIRTMCGGSGRVRHSSIYVQIGPVSVCFIEKANYTRLQTSTFFNKNTHQSVVATAAI